MDNLEKMDKFLEMYNFPRQNQEETENMNELITSNEVESVIKTIPPNKSPGTCLAVQWLRLRAPNAGNRSSSPGQGTKIPLAAQCNQKKKFKTIWLHRWILPNINTYPQIIPKNFRERKHKLIVWGQHHPDTKTRQR